MEFLVCWTCKKPGRIYVDVTLLTDPCRRLTPASYCGRSDCPMTDRFFYSDGTEVLAKDRDATGTNEESDND